MRKTVPCWSLQSLLVHESARRLLSCFSCSADTWLAAAPAQRAWEGSFSLFSYGIDRITRIYVPLIPALVLTCGIVVYGGGNALPWSFFGNLAGLQGVFVESYGGNAPLWSLAYEIWFYFLWGGILALLVSRSIPARSTAWAVVLAALAIFTKLEPLYLFCWLLGVLAKLSALTGRRILKLSCASVLIITGISLSQITSGTVSLNLQSIQRFCRLMPFRY